MNFRSYFYILTILSLFIVTGCSEAPEVDRNLILMERKAIEEQKEAQNAEYLSACGDFPKYKFSEDEDRYLICRKRFDDGECLMIHISVGGIDGDLYSIYDMERNDIYDYPTIFLGERDEVCAATTPEYFNSKLK